MTVEISRSVLAAIVGEAATSPDREVCGLLYGTPARIDRHASCANVAVDPRDAFEIDPVALLAAHRRARGGGEPILGCYHSHPGGDPMPSPRDAEAAAPDGWMWLIVGRGRAAAFHAVADGTIHGRFDPVELQVAPDP